MRKRPIMRLLEATFLLSLLLFCGCTSPDEDLATPPPSPSDLTLKKTNNHRIFNSVAKIPDELIEKADLKILFIGNSHTLTSPELLAKQFSTELPEIEVLIARAGGAFLIDHADSKRTLDFLSVCKWDYVILQGQKYSTSGKYSYSTEGAIKLGQMVNDNEGHVILFPEWSRKEFPDEYMRIDRIHENIAKKVSATIAPIGKTWENVQKELPELVLYEPDGNHASRIGHWINATVFFNLIVETEKLRPSPALLANENYSKEEIKLKRTIQESTGSGGNR